MPLSAWLPLQSAAGALREECSSLEQLVQELFTDIQRLGHELETKADELEEGRRHLAERGRQLAEQRKESARLSHQLEQQEAQLTEALTELRELRTSLANRPEPGPSPELSAELATLRQHVAELQVERAVLQERLAQAASGQGTPFVPTDSLTSDLIRELSSKFTGEFTHLKERLADVSGAVSGAVQGGPQPPAAEEMNSLKQDLLERLDQQFKTTASELQGLRTELAERSETPSQLPAGALESLTGHMTEQFSALQERMQSLQRESPDLTELDAMKQEKMELELELELVRARSGELQETVSRQKRELATQQLQVSDELRELRALIAERSEHISKSEAHERPAPVPAESHEEPEAKPQDPVVNSVMAQFAKLQRDIAQRRKKK
jgi:SMC interacting uncharacterized protein involved in chromosome segregation